MNRVAVNGKLKQQKTKSDTLKLITNHEVACSLSLGLLHNAAIVNALPVTNYTIIAKIKIGVWMSKLKSDIEKFANAKL